MLTVTHGRPTTRRHILDYTLLLVPVAGWLALTSVGGPVTLLTFAVLNVLFVKGAYQIWRRDDAAADADNYLVEKKFFNFRLYYLFLHFGALLVDATIRGLT